MIFFFLCKLFFWSDFLIFDEFVDYKILITWVWNCVNSFDGLSTNRKLTPSIGNYGLCGQVYTPFLLGIGTMALKLHMTIADAILSKKGWQRMHSIQSKWFTVVSRERTEGCTYKPFVPRQGKAFPQVVLLNLNPVRYFHIQKVLLCFFWQNLSQTCKV